MTTVDTERRCERTELPVSMCSHCRGLPWTVPTEPETHGPFDDPGEPAEPVRWFEASYHGKCAWCDEEIKPGDLIRRHERGYVGECCDVA